MGHDRDRADMVLVWECVSFSRFQGPPEAWDRGLQEHLDDRRNQDLPARAIRALFSTKRWRLALFISCPAYSTEIQFGLKLRTGATLDATLRQY